jgi:hypothetical protein
VQRSTEKNCEHVTCSRRVGLYLIVLERFGSKVRAQQLMQAVLAEQTVHVVAVSEDRGITGQEADLNGLLGFKDVPVRGEVAAAAIACLWMCVERHLWKSLTLVVVTPNG